jgi:3-isopropylmalate dehydrogenase
MCTHREQKDRRKEFLDGSFSLPHEDILRTAKMDEHLTARQTIPGWSVLSEERTKYTIGVLPGEGIGLEVIEASLQVLDAVSRGGAVDFNVQMGGKIGLSAKQETGRELTPDVIDFCESVFAEGGAVLCGPAGGRFVYELRSKFDLFCKMIPLRPLVPLQDTGVIKAEALKDVDILIVRENVGGIYFGRWGERQGKQGLKATHSFDYRQDLVERIIRVAVAFARARRRCLSLVLKTEGMPSISRLWIKVLEDLGQEEDLQIEILQVDNAAFQLLREARRFDVIVTPNLFGDILADCGGLLLGSRGMCFSGNLGRDGRAVYQTGHGGALDLAGRDRANPIGQIHSLSMLLRVSFGLQEMADRIEAAVEKALQDGWRTTDISSPGRRIVGTREMGRRIAQAVREHS